VDLDSSDAPNACTAIDDLHGNMSSDVYNRLKLLAEPREDGSYAEPDDRVRVAAIKALAGIEHWRTVYGAGETNYSLALSLGSYCVLSAMAWPLPSVSWA